MNTTHKPIVLSLIAILMTQILLGCASISTNNPDNSHTPVVIESSNSDFAIAQATIDSGQNQLSDLSLQSTIVSANVSRAENTAAQSTLDSNHRQKIDLDYQSTVVSLNIAQAADRQKMILQQTQIAQDVTTAARNQVATAAQSVFQVQATQTAHVQAILAVQAMQTNEAVAAQTAYPLTATPLAIIQASLLMQEYDREQKSFVEQIVVPLVPFLIILDMLLIIPVIILAYRRYWTKYWPRRMRLASGITPKPLIALDGGGMDRSYDDRIIPIDLTPAIPIELPGEKRPLVEWVDAADPLITLWIAEVEYQLDNEGGQSL